MHPVSTWAGISPGNLPRNSMLSDATYFPSEWQYLYFHQPCITACFPHILTNTAYCLTSQCFPICWVKAVYHFSSHGFNGYLNILFCELSVHIVSHFPVGLFVFSYRL